MIKPTRLTAHFSIALAALALLSAPAQARSPVAATSAEQPAPNRHAANPAVSAAHPLAAEAGRDMILSGGSATDAAMAMMLALTVVEPQSSGIGGGGFLLHHDAAKGLIDTIDGRETAPVSASETLFMGEDGKPMGFRAAVPGGRSVGVPGNIRLMEQAHRRWGRLEWARLFDPAIRLADQGFPVSKSLAGRLEALKALWADFPEARAIYWQDGRPKREGEIVRNPALAALLRTVAAQGPDAFYTGPAAKALIDTLANSPANPTVMTQADLSGYQAQWRGAVCAPYRTYKVCGMGPPSSGATTIIQMLGMIERFDMKAMGPDNPQSWHALGEAMRLAYADRETWLGDPDFVEVPVGGLIDPAYLKKRSALIAANRARKDYPDGMPPGATKRTTGISGEVAGTTHFVAVDSAGNIASMTSTIEGPFGSQLIANGFFLNNELTDFTFTPMKDGAPVANRVQAGKRPLSSMSPTIVYDQNGQPVLAIGSAGGKRIIMHVMKSLVAYMDFGMSAQQAVAQPNIYFDGKGLLVEQGSALEAMIPALQAMGHQVSPADLPSKLNAVEWKNGRWIGVVDPRGEGRALMP